MRALGWIFVGVWAAGAAVAQPQTPYDMRGVVLGTDLTTFRNTPPPAPPQASAQTYQNGRAACSGANAQLTSMGLFLEDEERRLGLVKCEWQANSGGRGLFMQMPVSLGDGSGYPSFQFAPDADGVTRLMEINVRSNMMYWAALLEAYKAKFGEPSVASAPVQNGFGAQFSSETASWSNGVSTIKIQSRCGRIELVCITYTHNALKDRYEAAKRAARGDPASRL